MKIALDINNKRDSSRKELNEKIIEEYTIIKASENGRYTFQPRRIS